MSDMSSEVGGSGARPATAKKLQRPMLSKDDKRRHYAKMFSEAFNSGDSKHLTSFVEKYCTAECVMIQKCVVTGNPYIPKYVEVFGGVAIIEFWVNTFLTVPDCLMVMLQTKLRIRNRHFNNAQVTSLSSNDSKTSLMDVSNEGSSIVSSFSFTGTKIYTTKMEGAIVQPPGSSSNSVHSASLSDLTIVSTTQVMELSGLSHDHQQQQSLALQQQADMVNGGFLAPTKAPKASKKRPFAATESAVVNPSAPSTAATASHPESSIDKFNIFLHPPRKYSTLAGTPFGGSPHYYTKSHNHHNGANSQNMSSMTKMSDYISINANTKFSLGDFMEHEGYINFLGTLTMTLDSDNKINKFEFIYSHMD